MRIIQEKLGISVERMKDPENPETSEDEELAKKRRRAALASFKWKATLKALTNKRDEEWKGSWESLPEETFFHELFENLSFVTSY